MMDAKPIFVIALVAILFQLALPQPINSNNLPATSFAGGAPQIIVVTPPERQAVLGVLGTILAPLFTNIARPIFTNLATGLLAALNRTNDAVTDGSFALPANAGDSNLYNEDAIFDAFLVQTADDRSDRPQVLLSPQEATVEAGDTPAIEKRPRVVPFGRVRLLPSPNSLGFPHQPKHDDSSNPELI